jgi:chromate transporter
MFISFLRLGLTAFGGLANMAYIHKMVVEDNQWLDDEAFRNGTALCQIVPGSTTMQLAAYVGLRICGITGAIVCLVGFGLPAFLLMMSLSALYTKTQILPTAVSVFNGLQPIVVAIMANATLLFGKTSLRTWRGIIIVGFAAITFGMGTTPVAVILLTGALGIVIYDGRQNHPQKVAPMAQPLFPRRLIFLLVVVAFGLTLLYLCNEKLFDLAATMAKIDLFAFGGGPASVPLMYHEIVEVRSWMNSSTLMNGIALGQLTPGPVIITATFVGYLLYGSLGGLIATVSVFLPSFLILVCSASYFNVIKSSCYFNKAVEGILCSVVGLLVAVTIQFALKISWDFPHVLLASGAFVGLIFKVDLLWIVLAGTIISALVL